MEMKEQQQGGGENVPAMHSSCIQLHSVSHPESGLRLCVAFANDTFGTVPPENMSSENGATRKRHHQEMVYLNTWSV